LKVRVRLFFKTVKFGKLELVFFQNSKVWKVGVSSFFKTAKVWKVRVKTKRPKSKLTPKVRLTYFYLWIPLAPTM
jgi:hypothetical protein